MVTMHDMLDSSLVGASTSLDNLTVGLALGLTGKDVPVSLNLQIAAANALVMALAMVGGEAVSDVLPNWVVNFLPGLVFVALGLAACSEFILELRASRQSTAPTFVRTQSMEESMFSPQEKPLQPVDQQLKNQMALLDKIDFYNVRATIPLTFGMCINNAGGGVAAGIANMDISLVSGLVGLFSVFFFAGGFSGGKIARSAATRMNNIRTSYISFVAGVLLVALGVAQLKG